MKTVEETRRELFERWYTYDGTLGKLFPTDSGQYISELAQGSWEAFNAALDAVEIELPVKYKTEEGYSMYDAEDVVNCIKATNLGVRVK